MEYTIESVKLGDEEVLAYIQTESWKAGFKDILNAGYSKVMLWVFEDNTRARLFYEKHGFKTKGKVKANTEPKEICYEKNL